MLPPSSVSINDEHKLSPNDHEIIIWLGDLNYRIDSSVPDEDIFQLLEMGRIDELAELDQLNIEKDKGAVFRGFHEGILRFPPTYKFIRGTDVYDQRPEKKVRCPSWCDRVLWRTFASLEQELVASGKFGGGGHHFSNSSSAPFLPGNPSAGFPLHCENVELMCYSRGNSTISDHKPVYASLNVKVKQVDWADSEQLLLDVVNEFAFYDGDLRETLTRSGGTPLQIQPCSINLHSIPPVGDIVQLQLTNCLDCAISFSVKVSSVPTWLRLDPMSSTLLQGKSIKMSAAADHIHASAAFGDEICKSDAAIDCIGAKNLIDASNRPEISAFIILEVKALKEKQGGAGSPPNWSELEPNTFDAGSLADVLIPVVCFLGSLGEQL